MSVKLRSSWHNVKTCHFVNCNGLMGRTKKIRKESDLFVKSIHVMILRYSLPFKISLY